VTMGATTFWNRRQPFGPTVRLWCPHEHPIGTVEIIPGNPRPALVWHPTRAASVLEQTIEGGAQRVTIKCALQGCHYTGTYRYDRLLRDFMGAVTTRRVDHKFPG